MNPCFTEVWFFSFGVGNHVNVWMVSFVVKGGIPDEITRRNLHGICHQVRVCFQKSPPCFGAVIAQPLSVFSHNGQDIGPDDSLMRCHFSCDFGEENLFLSCAEKSMRPSLLCARSHRNISDIVFPFVDDYPFSGCDISNEISCMAFGARR